MGLTSHKYKYVSIYVLALLFLGIVVIESLHISHKRDLQEGLRQQAKEDLSIVRFQLEGLCCVIRFRSRVALLRLIVSQYGKF